MDRRVPGVFLNHLLPFAFDLSIPAQLHQDIVHPTRTLYTPPGHCTPHQDIVHSTRTLYTPPGHCTLHQNIVHATWTFCTPPRHCTLHQDIAHPTRTLYTPPGHCTFLSSALSPGTLAPSFSRVFGVPTRTNAKLSKEDLNFSDQNVTVR